MAIISDLLEISNSDYLIPLILIHTSNRHHFKLLAVVYVELKLLLFVFGLQFYSHQTENNPLIGNLFCYFNESHQTSKIILMNQNQPIP